MKPKNRIYCRSCGRSKMLFETEKKALTFLKFNQDEILEENEVAPERAYYCESCMGWHVTHIKDGTEIELRMKKKITEFNELEKWRKEQSKEQKLKLAQKRNELAPQYQEHNNNIYNESLALLNEAKTLFQEGHIKEAREFLNKALSTSFEIKTFKGTGGGRFKYLRKEINELLLKYRY